MHSEARQRLLAYFSPTDERWDEIVPDEVLEWKFNRVREQKLEPLRNRIAHIISEPSGDLSLSPDSRENAREVTSWIRCNVVVLVFFCFSAVSRSL